MRPVVKVCGVRRAVDAERCVELGAAYIGCVLASDSPRCATVGEVQKLRDAVGDAAQLVLVFRGESEARIVDLCQRTGVRRVQIHGTSPAACRLLALQGIQLHPVFAVDPAARTLPRFDLEPTPRLPAVLDCGRGGGGRPFPWQILAPAAPPATLIAGGIGPDNVAGLLAYRPFGMDLSSGVEVRPGIKDLACLRDLFAVVASRDTEVLS